jgi:deoxyribodipyrimidine photo-lyase
MFPSTRDEALQRLSEFLPASGKYARDRNHVYPFEHDNVSRLSPAIRHRLLSEHEVAQAPLERYAASTVKKFTQEDSWRRYWKSWLSLRPQIWNDYRQALAGAEKTLGSEAAIRREAITKSQSGAAIMDLFTRELIETGYLHNHARMWWAGWWIHIERLPWELGADFFYRHLLDGDPASNTLSWRWVAGLQTSGKHYLPRRSNLEKYLPHELLKTHSGGLEKFVDPVPWKSEHSPAKPEITRKNLPTTTFREEAKTLLWVHEEDLSPEQCGTLPQKIAAVFLTADEDCWNNEGFSTPKRKWLRQALQDTLKRVRDQFPNARVSEEVITFTIDNLVARCRQHEVEQIITMRPEVGLLHDQLPVLQAALREHEIDLHFIDRKEDLLLRPLATAGFFPFWKKLQKRFEESN